MLAPRVFARRTPTASPRFSGGAPRSGAVTRRFSDSAVGARSGVGSKRSPRILRDARLVDLVRARAPLLLAWDEPRSPTHGVSDAFAICSVDIEEPTNALLEALYRTIHQSYSTVVLDQLIVAIFIVLAPLFLSGGLSFDEHPTLAFFGAALALLCCSRLMYLGWLA